MKVMMNILLLLWVPATFAQSALFEEKYVRLQEVDTLPSTMMTGKTVVLVDIPGDNRAEWERVTNSFHQQIMRTGIDAVAYYDIYMPFAGTDVTRTFLTDFRTREVENLILLQYRGDESRVAVTDMNYRFLLYNEKWFAWKKVGPLRDISRQLYVETANSGYDRSNYLINTVAERGFLKDPIHGDRSDFFSIALKGSKLAVPWSGNARKDSLMKAIFREHYPFSYGFVDPDTPLPELDAGRFKFVLRWITSPQDELREMLGYEAREGVTEYVATRRRNGRSNLVRIPLKANTTKFYIMELDNEEVFLGTEWDADVTWSEALINHINSYKSQMGI